MDNTGSEEYITSYDSTVNKCYSNPYEIDNLEIVNRVLNGIKEEKIGQVIRYFAKNIELIFDGEEIEIPFADTYFGKRSVKKGLQKFFRAVYISDLIIENQVEEEESITSYTRLQGKIPSTKKTFDMEYVFTFEVNERGKVEKCFITYNVYSVGLALSTRGKGHIISDTTTSPQLQFLYSYFKTVSKPFLSTATYEDIRAA
ncbi:MAG: hypothetical protein OQK82_09105, partial [Candidatus Pacearchaeota archaeon]|nr:hypothetical protein [Candidatus Pacearchaeota archaeon]